MLTEGGDEGLRDIHDRDARSNRILAPLMNDLVGRAQFIIDTRLGLAMFGHHGLRLAGDQDLLDRTLADSGSRSRGRGSTAGPIARSSVFVFPDAGQVNLQLIS